MKYTILLLLAAFVFVGGLETVNAQKKADDKMKMSKEKTKKAVRFASMQKSPTDISYMRKDDDRRGEVYAKAVYSRPFKNDREIFGGLVPFGKVWRTGADEATEITFYKDVMFGGKEVKAGSYALYTIPNEDSWVVMLNSTLHQWGAFGYDKSTDVAMTTADVQSLDESVENFSIAFGGGNMVLAWDTTMIAVPIKVK